LFICSFVLKFLKYGLLIDGRGGLWAVWISKLFSYPLLAVGSPLNIGGCGGVAFESVRLEPWTKEAKGQITGAQYPCCSARQHAFYRVQAVIKR
jgi:hypothetical protein